MFSAKMNQTEQKYWWFNRQSECAVNHLSKDDDCSEIKQREINH